MFKILFFFAVGLFGSINFVSGIALFQSFSQIKNKDFPANFTRSRFKYYSLGAYSSSSLVSNSINSCSQECEENEFCFIFKYDYKECFTFRKVCVDILIDSTDSTLYSKDIPDLNLVEYSLVVTRDYSPLEKTDKFSNELTTDGVNFLVTIKMSYIDGFCVSGFSFIYNDGTTIRSGYDGHETDHLSIDLNLKKIYSIDSYCGWICDRIQICTVDLISAERICFDAGNRSLLTSLTANKINDDTNTEKNPHVANINTEDMCIKTYFGEYADYYGNHCVRNLGIKYFS